MHFSFPTIPITTFRSSRSSTLPHLFTPFALVLLEYVLDHLGLLLPFMFLLLALPFPEGRLEVLFCGKPLFPTDLNTGPCIGEQGNTGLPEQRQHLRVACGERFECGDHCPHPQVRKVPDNITSPAVGPYYVDNIPLLDPYVLRQTPEPVFCQGIHYLDRNDLAFHG